MSNESAGVPREAEEPTGSGAEFDATAASAILAASGQVARRLSVSGTVLFVAWGTAWTVGYLLLWATARGASPQAVAPGWALATYFALLIGAGVVTAVHVTRRSRGLRGQSATTGTMYGLSWAFAFVAVSMVIGAMARHGLDPEQMAVLSNGIASLVVGTLYMAGAAMSREKAWFVLGAWIVAVTAFACFLPVVQLYLVMALAGGGGMLVAAAVTANWRTRGRRSPR